MLEDITFKLAFDDTRADLITGVHERLNVVEQRLAAMSDKEIATSVFICGMELLRCLEKLEADKSIDLRLVAKDYHIFIRSFEQLSNSTPLSILPVAMTT